MVRPKKKFGQHFLLDKNICSKIILIFEKQNTVKNVLEIGPGTGALSELLLANPSYNCHLLDIDKESIDFLKAKFPSQHDQIHFIDFLQFDAVHFFHNEPFSVIGNFPYNISSQILFKCIEQRNNIETITGMFQKEVAERVAEKPGSKKYGILSVFMQAFFDIDYCFTVPPSVFDPPPKVQSGVITCRRNTTKELNCNEALFFKVVKSCFNQRRKTIRNSLKPLLKGTTLEHDLLQERPEQLSVSQFVELTNLVTTHLKD